MFQSPWTGCPEEPAGSLLCWLREAGEQPAWRTRLGADLPGNNGSHKKRSDETDAAGDMKGPRSQILRTLRGREQEHEREKLGELRDARRELR